MKVYHGKRTQRDGSGYENQEIEEGNVFAASFGNMTRRDLKFMNAVCFAGSPVNS